MNLSSTYQFPNSSKIARLLGVPNTIIRLASSFPESQSKKDSLLSVVRQLRQFEFVHRFEEFWMPMQFRMLCFFVSELPSWQQHNSVEMPKILQTRCLMPIELLFQVRYRFSQPIFVYLYIRFLNFGHRQEDFANSIFDDNLTVI